MTYTKPTINVHFLGAAGTVTGSKYLIEYNHHKMLVDCGLFQGLKKLRKLNWTGLPVPIEEIEYVLLTHGHLDHCGYLPRLKKLGFEGEILGTDPTLEIATIVLRDSAKIQEESAKKANTEHYTKHKPAQPLYTVRDADHAIERFRSVDEGEWIPLFENVKVRFQYIGHIIGASFIELKIEEEVLLFSGDVGRTKDTLLKSPKKPKKADYLFIESTYGDRIHDAKDPYILLKEYINQTIEERGTVLLPCFAVERAQTVMYLLWKLKSSGDIPDIPLVLDSPMGGHVLDVFERLKEWHDLPSEEFNAMKEAFWIVQDFQESKLIIASAEPKVIVAGSGMLSGGRILSYLEHYLSKPTTSIILTGFQAEGTRGRALLNGSSFLKLYGQYIKVKATIYNLDEMSSHADQIELVDWLNEIENTPKRVFITHGEPHAADAFRVILKDSFNWNPEIPELYEITEL